MKICSRCVLPETFPGISFNQKGQCSYCSSGFHSRNLKKNKAKFSEKFNQILSNLNSNGPYDVLMAYSGGKDSTYTLRLLVEKYHLKVIAVTFDHGFVSETAIENIKKITNHLQVDHEYLVLQTEIIKKLFVNSLIPERYPLAALKRASPICISCMNIVKSYLLKKAVEENIPLIAYGWSPGQAPPHASVFKTNPLTIYQMQKAIRHPFQEMVGEKLNDFFFKNAYLLNPSKPDDEFPYIIHPLAFLDFNEKAILANIQEIGWVAPKDTDSNSTNCLLNSFAIEHHIRNYGFHPYSLEIAALVREGYLTRDQGIEKLNKTPHPEIIDLVKKRLSIQNTEPQ